MILIPKQKIDDYVSKGWWNEETLGERFIATARRKPDTPAVADPPNRPRITGEQPQHWTWNELLLAVGRMAACLHELGLRKDDIVVVQMPNCVELHAIYLACACTGIIASPVPMQYRSHEITHIVGTTGASAAITTAKSGQHQPAKEWVEHFASQLRVLAFGENPPDGALALVDRLAATRAWSAEELSAHIKEIGLTAHDVLTVCWTSGTEARPKGVPRSHNEWMIVARNVVEAGQLEDGARMTIPFPFVNMAGISTSLAAWLQVGGELHHHHPFDIDVFISQLRDHPTDYTVAPPAILTMLLKNPEKLQGVELGRLKRIGSGGGPLASWLVEQFAQQFGIEIVNYFGSNEGAALTSCPLDVPDRHERAQYFPRFGVPELSWALSNAKRISTRLVDLDTGEDIQEPGRVGELRFQGPTIFSGYFNAPELTERAFDEQNYYRTGDLFEIAGDRNQYYRFAGRHKDIVIRGGMNISCEEVEGLLLSYPKLKEVAVIGVPDDVLGERLCAVVVPRGDQTITLEELVDFLRNSQQLAVFKLPEKLALLDELPRNPVGKVLKRELRQHFAATAGTTI